MTTAAIETMTERTATERALHREAQRTYETGLAERAELFTVKSEDSPLFAAAQERIRKLNDALPLVKADVEHKRRAYVESCAKARADIASELTPARRVLIKAARKEVQAAILSLNKIAECDDDAIALCEGSAPFPSVVGIGEQLKVWLDSTSAL